MRSWQARPVTCSAAILAASRWPAGPLAWRAHARQGEAVAARMAALQVAPSGRALFAVDLAFAVTIC
ncbi:MAG TPA: hypothetical protein VH599_06360 [Ktedonobacterales bacterium]